MYSPTTPREVTVVDGVQLIIASPPARDHRNADGSAHMWRPRPPPVVVGYLAGSCSTRTFIFETVATRRGSRCSLHKSLLGVSVEAVPVVHPYSSRVPHFAGRCTFGKPIPVDARPSVLFRENTNLEWMVLVSRKRTPPVESIFRAGLRVRTERAASA